MGDKNTFFLLNKKETTAFLNLKNKKRNLSAKSPIYFVFLCFQKKGTMKPIKNLEPIAKWILRCAAVVYVFSLYYKSLQSFEFSNIHYLLNFIYCLFFVLLFIGGFQKGNTLTIISGIVVSLISVYKVYWEFNGSFLDTQLYVFLMLLGIGVFFTSRGNS